MVYLTIVVMMMMMVMMAILIMIMSFRTPLLLSLLHSAGQQTIRQLLSLGEDPGARDMVSCTLWI